MLRLVIVLFLILCGCSTTAKKIASERQEFLEKPSMGTLGYSGVMRGGEHYRYLVEHDAAFGDFLLSVVPQTERADIVLAALYYFAYAKPDSGRFEEVVGKIRSELLAQKVGHGDTDVLCYETLSWWINDIRRLRKSRTSRQSQRA